MQPEQTVVSPKAIQDAIDHGHALGAKCDMCASPDSPGMYSPLGGAKSFAEMEEWANSQALSNEIGELTSQFQMMMGNIMGDGMASISEKAAAAAALTAEFQTKVANPEVEDEDVEEVEEDEDEGDGEKVGKRMNNGQAGALQKAHELISSVLGWATYGDGKGKKPRRAVGALQNDPPPMQMTTKELPSVGGFKVYQDSDGDLRWLSLSSNAFIDLDKEIFTTKALEDAVEYSDKSGERGPLLVYHVPSAEIGRCDYQAVVGRFLVESGKFDDTPLGRKAADYFVNTDKEHQVSIGYHYRPGDELDGVYDWTRIIERSVTPYGAAANPWTAFNLIGGKTVDARKEANLKEIFGSELADRIIATAESKTKELESSMAYKAFKPFAKGSNKPADAEDAADGGADDDTENADGSKKPAAKKSLDDLAEIALAQPEGELRTKMLGDLTALGWKAPEEDDSTQTTTGFDPEVVAVMSSIGTALTDLTGQVAAMREQVTGLDSQVKELKEGAANRPRMQVVSNGRPTDSDSNLLDPTKVKEVTDAMGDDQDTNPARGYVEDILARGKSLAFSS